MAVARWAAVVAGTLVLVAAPLASRALPADESEVSAAELLARVQASGQVPHSGYVEAVGSIALPDADELSTVADLLGERSRLRTWWRSPDEWRVDRLSPSGENGLFVENGVVTEWSYEAERAVLSALPMVRLPWAGDLVPSALARLALSGARADEVSSLPAARVAGRDAAGLRLRPADAQASIDRVDVWADSETGLPLRVEVYAEGVELPSVSTEFLDVSFATPAAEVVRYRPTTGADYDQEDALDVAVGADRYSPYRAPTTLAGLEENPDVEQAGAVGVYGRGLSTMFAVPLWDRAAEPLRDQLEATPGAEPDELGLALAVGPLNLRLTDEIVDDVSWLVVGAVEPGTVDRAASQLVRTLTYSAAVDPELAPDLDPTS